GVCETRSYDGEPAMKLEPLLAKGHLVPGFETTTENGIIRTAHLFSDLDRAENKADAAYSLVYNVLNEMVASAVDDAQSNGEKHIGITGGVSYDVPIVRMVEEIASKYDMDIYFHNRVPNGDGGISTRQASIALRKL
ncbi:MAG: carbamoyltransferase HypF, partial [archaeon]|nr:carbamoyltransferase HypF [archaeon]